MRGRDDAHVRAQHARCAEALELPLLQHPQQLGLGARRQLADLVEQQHAAGRALDEAGPRLRGARERAPLVAEQLRLDQRLGQGRAVDRQERAGRPAATRRG